MMNLTRLDDGISVWDPFYVLCPGATCEAVVQGKPLFLDGDHLSTYANELLYPSFVQFLKTLDRASVRGAHQRGFSAMLPLGATSLVA
jgi:hypothetical protein